MCILPLQILYLLQNFRSIHIRRTFWKLTFNLTNCLLQFIISKTKLVFISLTFPKISRRNSIYKLFCNLTLVTKKVPGGSQTVELYSVVPLITPGP